MRSSSHSDTLSPIDLAASAAHGLLSPIESSPADISVGTACSVESETVAVADPCELVSSDSIRSATRLSGPQSGILHDARGWVLRNSAMMLHGMLGRRPGDAFGILMYHRIAENPAGVARPTWNVTPARFREQLVSLLEHGHQAWSLQDALQAHRAGRRVPDNVFVVTFDDGYQNNYSQAFPILKELNVPATIFLATAFLDTNRPFPFDDWSAAGSDRVSPDSWLPLTTSQCLEMSVSGLIELGCHTHTHQSFIGRTGEFRDDLAASRETLRTRFGIEHPTLALPFGHYTQAMLDAAFGDGFECVLSTDGHRVAAGEGLAWWGRFCVEDCDSGRSVAAKLSGWQTPVDDALRAAARPFKSLKKTVGSGLRFARTLRRTTPSGRSCASP